MAKLRIEDVAKKLNVPAQMVMKKLEEIGIFASNAQNTLSQEEVLKVVELITGKKPRVKAKAPKAEKPAEAAEAKAEKPVKKAAAGKTEFYIQSPLGGNITPEEVIAKVPEGTDKCYVRVDHNLIWWVRGDGKNGVVEIWE